MEGHIMDIWLDLQIITDILFLIWVDYILSIIARMTPITV